MRHCMANKAIHRGIIKDTFPKPTVFWGTLQEIADHCDIKYRAAALLFQDLKRSTRSGFRAMTEEEQELHYQPPKAKPISRRTSKTYESKKNWKITFFKNWKKGEKYPDLKEEPDRIFTGSPQEFSLMVNCNLGMIYRLINTHEGKKEKYPLKSIKGWTIARIRRYGKDI